MKERRGDAVVRRWNELFKKRAVWHEMWQLVGEYVHQMKMDFLGTQPQGSMLNENLFDSTAVDASTKSASALIGMLWGGGSKSFILQPPEGIQENAEEKAYYDWANKQVRKAFDEPRAGFAGALEEYMNDQTGLGTSGIATFEDPDTGLSFEAWGVDEMALALGFGGNAEVVYRHYCWDLRRVVRTYGVDALSPKLQKLVRDGKLDEKVRIIHAVEPREELVAGNFSNLNMPFRSEHVEFETKHVIKESGYPEIPVAIGMFYKRRGEDYGRSMGMKALPDTLEINALKEARTLAIELALDPPTGVMNDSIMGNQKMDKSPGSVTVFKSSGKLKGGAPVFPLINPANIRESDKAIEELKANINSHFLLDRLLDFNNKTEMTLGEVQYRAQLRGESLGSIFYRQERVLQQVIERAVSILFRANKLGVIEGSIQHRQAVDAGFEPMVVPERIAKLILSGSEFYRVKFMSPAARIMEAEEANGIQRAWQAAQSIAATSGQPDVIDGLDADKSLEILSKNFGVPAEIRTSMEKIKAIRQQRMEMQAQQAAMQQAQAGADVLATAAKAGDQV